MTVPSLTVFAATPLEEMDLAALQADAKRSFHEEAEPFQKTIEPIATGTGMGCCALRHPAFASLMQETLL